MVSPAEQRHLLIHTTGGFSSAGHLMYLVSNFLSSNIALIVGEDHQEKLQQWRTNYILNCSAVY